MVRIVFVQLILVEIVDSMIKKTSNVWASALFSNSYIVLFHHNGKRKVIILILSKYFINVYVYIRVKVVYLKFEMVGHVLHKQ